MNQNNGNTQLNSERENYNERVDKMKNLGSTKGRVWKRRRRNRTI